MPKTLTPEQLAALDTLRDEYNSLIARHGENATLTLYAGVALAQKMDEYGIHDAEGYPAVDFQGLLGTLDLFFALIIMEDSSVAESAKYKDLTTLIMRHNPSSAPGSPKRMLTSENINPNGSQSPRCALKAEQLGLKGLGLNPPAFN